MAKKFRFPQPSMAKRAKEEVLIKSNVEWTPEQLEAMSETTDKDLDETREWLGRTGQTEAAAMFDAE